MYYFKGRNFSFPLGEKTYVMGILNITPDSFFDGGKWNQPDVALRHAMDMQSAGADLLDIGAQSTRPGHVPLSAKEELDIVQQFLPKIMKHVSVPVSIDTFYPEVAQYALEQGVAIINDVSGIFSDAMANLVREYQAGWILMHSGESDADSTVSYPQGVTKAVCSFFDEMQSKCIALGIQTEQLCFDMGIGFGKSHQDNLTLIQNIQQLKKENRALLTALSCKRMVANETKSEGDDRLFGTIAADTLAIAGGTDFIRVHHVKEAVLAAKMTDALVRR